MKLQELEKSLSKIHNGTFFKITWRNTPSKVAASVHNNGHCLEKEVTTTVRKGIQYRNIKKVQETFIERGDFVVNPFTGKIELTIAPLADYWEWYIPKVILHHKNKDQYYLRLYTTINKPHVQWYFDGKPVTEKEVKENGWMQPSYWNVTPHGDPVMTVKVADIIKIN